MIRNTLGHFVIVVSISFLLSSCDEEPTKHTSDMPDVTGPDPASISPSVVTASTMSLALPFAGTVSSSGPAFRIVQEGSGNTAIFDQTGTSGSALKAQSEGISPTFSALNVGTNGTAARITSASALNTMVALEVSSSSRGGGLWSEATGVLVNTKNTSTTIPSMTLNNSGKGPVLKVNHKGSAGDLAVFQTANTNKIRFSRLGRGYFNGGTQLGGADVAEAFDVEGSLKAYEPGDVLAISEKSDRTVEKSTEAYSTRVVGVYATKPGVLLTERDIDASLDDMVPVGVVGVIPTKVTTENGSIRRGDLLVSARTGGHAMVADPERLRFGMVLGKALENFKGPGTGTIRVLVNVR